MKKTLLLLILSLHTFVAQAHDIDPRILNYILDNPQASLTDLYNLAEETENKDMLDYDLVGTVLQLPGKKLAAKELMASDKSIASIQAIVGDDPMLNELGLEKIQEYISQPQPSLTDVEQQYVSPSFLHFIFLGVIHILAGVDHILFVLVLLLLLPPVKAILKVLTTFTIAHSLTFLLGGTGILTLSSKIVEPIIALSIAFVAFGTLKKAIPSVPRPKEIFVIFFFGLFHGLGFAGVFAEYTPQQADLLKGVLGFNIGVELGQIAIVLISLPIIGLLYKYLPSRKTKNTMAYTCIILGLYWMMQRILS